LMGIDLRAHVAARYAYTVLIAFAEGRATRIQLPRVRTTLVVSPLSLPGKLALGANRIRFVGTPSVPVKTRCRWVERHRAKLSVSLNAIGCYLDGDATRRNLLVAAPGQKLPIRATLRGRKLSGDVLLAGPFFGFSSVPAKRPVRLTDAGKPTVAEFAVTAPKAKEGDVFAFEVAVREGEHTRRMAAQLLMADPPLVAEAEWADRQSGEIVCVERPAASSGAVAIFKGDGALSFDLAAPKEGKYALWLRARWAKDSGTAMRLTLDKGKPRDLRAMAMIGFTDWTDPRRAHTKMFAHYGEQFAHWSWYRIPDVQLAKGKHRLTLAAGAGAAFDALLLLPQNPEMDRAAMNLFQNWNYAPWQNPL